MSCIENIITMTMFPYGHHNLRKGCHYINLHLQVVSKSCCIVVPHHCVVTMPLPLLSTLSLYIPTL
jgi:hypothetical protein